jgi:DNA-binding MltR family transcriptional regulator
LSYSDKKGYVKPPINPHKEPYVDQLNSLLESLHEHDDRSLILTIAAFAEDTLEQLLLDYLREPKQAKELVNGFNAPLGTFSARIKTAFVLGLMRKDHYQTLESLRKIRNKFAHNWDGVSIDREDIASLVAQLSPSRRVEYLASEDDACEISTRQRVVEKMSDILIDLRMLAKSLNKRDIKAPLIMGENKPVHMDLVVVDELPD